MIAINGMSAGAGALTAAWLRPVRVNWSGPESGRSAFNPQDGQRIVLWRMAIHVAEGVFSHHRKCDGSADPERLRRVQKREM